MGEINRMVCGVGDINRMVCGVGEINRMVWSGRDKPVDVWRCVECER